MADFPALEVMTVGSPGLPLGHRVPLEEHRLGIGRGASSDVVILSGTVARQHCEVVFEHGRWWVRDLGSSNGTFVRGERVDDAELEHGDCFEVAWGPCFRLLLREPEDVRDEAMERAIRESPDDDRRWSVYADWLQERGAPLGERLSNPLPADDLRWLGPAGGDAFRGELQVEWTHGLPRRATIRCLSGLHAEVSWETRLATLRRQPEFRFLRELEVDVGSFHRAALETRWAAQLLDDLGDSFPLLERIAVGPGTWLDDPAPLEGRLVEVRRTHPRLTTTASSLGVPWRGASLCLEAIPAGVYSNLAPGQSLALRGPAHVDADAGAEIVIRVPPPMCGFRVHFAGDRWVLEAANPRLARTLHLNGRARLHGLLRGGDVIEPASGVRLRFEA